MENSTQQLTNVLDAFTIRGEIPPGPVLLVDDTVDSRWTLTVIGEQLRAAGTGPAFPFALTDALGA